jgi:protein phosphatase
MTTSQALTCAGQRRRAPHLSPDEIARENQDGFFADDRTSFYAVFDFHGTYLGTGGRAYEGLRVARELLTEHVKAAAPAGLVTLLRLLHDRLLALHVPRTPTCSVIVSTFAGPVLSAAHVGNCRLYLFRQGTLQALTYDHTLEGDACRNGQLAEIAAVPKPVRRLSTRTVGSSASPLEPDLFSMRTRPGDRFLYLTDGVWSSVTEAAITTALCGPLADVPTRLLQLAENSGSVDDLAAVVVETMGTA